jgi:hypothetical protein
MLYYFQRSTEAWKEVVVRCIYDSATTLIMRWFPSNSLVGKEMIWVGREIDLPFFIAVRSQPVLFAPVK